MAATKRPVTVTLSVGLWKEIKAEAKKRGERMYDFVPAVLMTGLRRMKRGGSSKKKTKKKGASK